MPIRKTRRTQWVSSLFANSIDILRKIDTEYDSYANEFGLGRKRIFVAPEMLTDENGNKVFDENDTVFYRMPEETLKDTNPIYEVNMELRTEQHSKALNDDLNYHMSMKCGFGTERYKFEKGTVATATQVISENSDMYRSLCKHEIRASECPGRTDSHHHPSWHCPSVNH